MTMFKYPCHTTYYCEKLAHFHDFLTLLKIVNDSMFWFDVYQPKLGSKDYCNTLTEWCGQADER